jgi:Zn-dependent peptidase ImmA (M78 family)
MLDSKARESAEKLLRKFKVTSPPVPVDKIAKKLGIVLCEFPATDDSVSGAIIKTQGKTIIAINPRHHSNRQRFTIAHELGHYFFDKNLSEHVDQDFRVSWRNEDSSKAIDWSEIRANAFAAELLIPTDFLKADLDSLTELSKRTVVLLATRYKVSPEAMKIRLTNLGITPPF